MLREEILEESGSGKSGARGHHFSGNIADLVVAVNVELVLAIGEAGLRDSLESTRPGEPLRNGHMDILAAREATNKSGGLQECYKVWRASERQCGRRIRREARIGNPNGVGMAYYEEEKMSGTEVL